ncbi:MAG: DJ-1/PfpI family protein [Sandaracinaceae bacterium]|nr:DJ-1/PfpI family protein [Sandaracinaceae bacterium]
MSQRAQLLAIVFPGCAYLEIAHAVAMGRSRAEVRFVSPDGGSVATSDGPRIAAEGSFREASIEGVVAVIVPGGELDAVADDDALSSLLRRAEDAGAVVGGICNGAIVLARAGLLRGRRVTHTVTERHAPVASWGPLRAYADPLLEGSTYVDRPVVVDGPIVTAKPWASIAFAAELSVRAGLETPTDAARAATRARGERWVEPLAYFAIALRRADAPMTRALVEAHVAYLRELDRAGALVIAGPFAGEPEGLVVVRADDLAAAEVIAARDPFVVGGARLATVRRWEISCEGNAHMGIATGPLAP